MTARMAVFMFVFVGLAPLSGAATGALLRGLPVPTLFVAAGALLTGMALFARLGSRMRGLGDLPAGPAPVAPEAAGH